jgi:hypothetical protein
MGKGVCETQKSGKVDGGPAAKLGQEVTGEGEEAMSVSGVEGDRAGWEISARRRLTPFL